MSRRRMLAAALAVIGAGLTLRPDQYRSPTYRVLFTAAPARWWGIAFLIVAAIAAARRVPRPVAVPALAGLLCTWSAGLGAATVLGYGLSPTAFVWPALVAGLTIHSATQPPP